MRAAIYTRISEDKVGDGAGVGRQLQDCRELCDRHDWDVVDTYEDNDISASRFARRARPEYQRLLEDAKAGGFDVVVADHPDRLHRKPLELEHFMLLLDATGITVTTVTAGDYDLATGDGQFKARIIGAVAAKESADKSRRITRKHRGLAEKGALVGGGNRPFGYDKVKQGDKVVALDVRPGEAALIREAARRVLQGESLYVIINDWTERGVATVTGSPWNTKTLRQILTSGRVAGWRDHHGEPTAKAQTGDGKPQWPAILDESTWSRVRAVLLDPARKRTRVSRSYLLGPEVLRCGRCGAALHASPQRNTAGEMIPAYGCRKERGGCGRMSVRAEPVEELVVDWTLDSLDDVDFVARMKAKETGADDGAATEVLAGLQAAWDDATQNHARKLYDDHDLKVARDALRPQIEAAKAGLAGAVRRRPDAALAGVETVRDDWEGLSLDRKRTWIGMVIEAITIKPVGRGHNRFDPSRVVPTFRV